MRRFVSALLMAAMLTLPIAEARTRKPPVRDSVCYGYSWVVILWFAIPVRTVIPCE